MARLLDLARGLALVVVLAAPSLAVELKLFYPFGGENGDKTLPVGDDVSSEMIVLDESIVFYNKSYSSLYMNVNGLVTFSRPEPDYQPETRLPLGTPSIAIFLADIDTTAAGTVFYRSLSPDSAADNSILDRAATDIREYFSEFSTFTPTFAFLATWYQVGSYKESAEGLNTFQMVIVTDGVDSFTIFHYLDDGVQWMQSQGKSSRPDIFPQAGFDAGAGGRHYTLPGSGTSGTFTRGSNVNVDGVWMYHIGNTGTSNVQPADTSIASATLFDLAAGSPYQTCRDAACHQYAECVDHETGHCCRCTSPYYGNGIDCLEPGVSQKVNGILRGTLNGVSLGNDTRMHTYVVTTDGRTYTAIRPVPAKLGTAILTLTSVGGIIGWLFAKPVSPMAKNGYHFTGGTFNRTAKVTFQFPGQADKVVKLEQVFSGHDQHNKINMQTRLDGELPEISPDQVVTIDNYHENYKRTAPGVIKSFVSRTYRVNDVAYRYSWDNTIMFSECDGQRLPQTDVMKVKVSRHYVLWDRKNERMRIAMTSHVGVLANDNPCQKASCAHQARCVPEGESYRCVCRDGYRGNGETCTDVDECEVSRPCDRHAQCWNTAGSFTCRCGQGFTGDGFTCRELETQCGDQVCSRHAKCVFPDGTQQPTCQCTSGFHGDGISCTPTDNDCSRDAAICGDGRCVYDEDLREYVCEGNDGFSGDGGETDIEMRCGNCDRYAECLPDPYRNNAFSCQCLPGFTGDGTTCSRIDVCNDCHRDALCVLNRQTSDYECQCRRGYRGNGRECTERDCREDESMCASPEKGGLCWFDESRNFSICRCNYGYRGDGFRCKRLTCDEYNFCDQQNGKCVLHSDGFRCQCNQGYEGDGKRCTLATSSEGCDVLNDCDSNARCERNPDPRASPSFVCRCRPGYRGDGKYCTQTQDAEGCDVLNDCDSNARCERSSNPWSSPSFVCRCRPGYRGDGKYCTKVEDVAAPCNQVNNCDRHAECMYDDETRAYRCVCGRGYQGNGLQCRRKEEPDCRRDVTCSPSATCVPGAGSAYVCVCRPGYRGDGVSCSPVVHEGNLLVYAQGNKIMGVNTENQPGDYGHQIIFKPDMLAVALTTDCVTGDFYWTDVANGAIHTSKSDGTGIMTLMTGLKSPEGIAVDHSGRNMYFTDSDRLLAARLDGSEIKTLVDTDMRDARALVLDVNQGVVYWTDWNREKPQIERVNMDGSDRQVLVDDDLKLPNGLTFDSYSQTLCWGDAGKKRIECIRSDGVGRRQVYDQARYPFDLTMLNNVIYWTDWQMSAIPNININGDTTNDSISQALGGNGKKYGITAVRERCPREYNSCRTRNGGCKFLCLPSPNGGRTCACPDNYDSRACDN